MIELLAAIAGAAIIEATADAAELNAYITSPDYPVWPNDPSVIIASDPES